MSNPIPPYIAGMICEVDDVPGIDDVAMRKPRPVVILYPRSSHESQSVLIGIGITSSPSEEKLNSGQLVELPDTSKYKTATTGLDRPSWAVANWLLCPINSCRVLRVMSEQPLGNPYIVRLWELVQKSTKNRSKFEIRCTKDQLHNCPFCRESG